MDEEPPDDADQGDQDRHPRCPSGPPGSRGPARRSARGHRTAEHHVERVGAGVDQEVDLLGAVGGPMEVARGTGSRGTGGGPSSSRSHLATSHRAAAPTRTASRMAPSGNSRGSLGGQTRPAGRWGHPASRTGSRALRKKSAEVDADLLGTGLSAGVRTNRVRAARRRQPGPPATEQSRRISVREGRELRSWSGINVPRLVGSIEPSSRLRPGERCPPAAGKSQSRRAEIRPPTAAWPPAGAGRRPRGRRARSP